MSECTHDCSTCSENCGERDPKSLIEKPNAFSHIKKVIGVVSGKGGVGKSLVTGLLASAVCHGGKQAAVLDADITGPSVPKMFGIHGRAEGCEWGILPMFSRDGVKVMSLNLLVDDETTPVIWRGAMISNTVKQFWTDVVWDDVDVMFLDMPPGTGDVPLTVFQSMPVDALVVVTSPQELVGMIVAKAINMAKTMNVPVVGLVENMSYLECPDCGKRIEVFGASKAEKVAHEFGIEATARLPIDPKIAHSVDEGRIEAVDTDALARILAAIDALPVSAYYVPKEGKDTL